VIWAEWLPQNAARWRTPASSAHSPAETADYDAVLPYGLWGVASGTCGAIKRLAESGKIRVRGGWLDGSKARPDPHRQQAKGRLLPALSFR
jgi:hypothetical protein